MVKMYNEKLDLLEEDYLQKSESDFLESLKFEPSEVVTTAQYKVLASPTFDENFKRKAFIQACREIVCTYLDDDTLAENLEGTPIDDKFNDDIKKAINNEITDNDLYLQLSIKENILKPKIFNKKYYKACLPLEEITFTSPNVLRELSLGEVIFKEDVLNLDGTFKLKNASIEANVYYNFGIEYYINLEFVPLNNKDKSFKK